MRTLRIVGLVLIGVILLAVLPAAHAAIVAPERASVLALPESDWWLVIHNQCDDTLHWISPTGEYTSIPRPQMPNEAPGVACGYKALHISQDGRYLVQVAALNSGRAGVGFYDLQTAQWLQVHQTNANEFARLGLRYSSDANNRIAISFANDMAAMRAWRVILFDMTTGDVVDELRSDGSEIAGFVGGEFLADALTVPEVVLLAIDEADESSQVRIRFDGFEDVTPPLGTLAWYPQGAPGVAQELVSDPNTAQDMDFLPNGHAVFAYTDSSYPAGPPVGEGPILLDSNAVSLVLPSDIHLFPAPQLFFADGVSTLYNPQWAADGRVALFRRSDGISDNLYWVRIGSAMLTPLTHQAAQVLGVPTGFVYNTADSIYFMGETALAPAGPILTDPALSGGMAFVWASSFGDVPLTLTEPGGGALPPPPPPPPGTGQPDLFVSEFALNPATPVMGEPVEVRVGVYNQGSTIPTGTNFRIEWYPGENYPTPACDWTLDGLVGTGGRILTCTYPGYPSWYGSINTLVKVDTTNIVTESDEANNSFKQALSVNDTASPPPVAQPDLFVSEFALNPATPVMGEPVEVRVGVYNQGSTIPTGTNFRIEWYPGENYPTPACDWTLDGLVGTGGRILTCTYPGYPSWYGSINTLVKVDTTNIVTENNEANNSYSEAISVNDAAPPPPVGQPDLFVSEFALNPATPVEGESVEVRVGVYNQGSTIPTGTNFRIEWYPGENYPTPACDWTLDGLVGTGGRILTCTYPGYPSWYGSINTLVKVDTTNTVTESNEGNNSFSQAISVTASAPAPGPILVTPLFPVGPVVGQPDLYVSEFALNPTTPVQGQPVQVRVGVYNQGNASVSGTNFRIEWYPGENYPAPACDWTLDSMSAGGGRILTCTYAGYPSWYGSINTLVKVDTTNTVTESNEGNNSFSQAISVSKP